METISIIVFVIILIIATYTLITQSIEIKKGNKEIKLIVEELKNKLKNEKTS